jgi:hypothetical protein
MTIDTRQANGDVVFANMPQHIYQMFKGYYVESGMDPTGGGASDMEVDIAAGVVYVAGVKVTYAGGTATITAAHATLPRKDIISINAAGTLVVTAGTPAAADPAGDTGNTTFVPIPPSVPTDKTLIAEVYVPAAAVGIVDANVTDWRGIADFATGEFDWGLSFRGTIDGIVGAPNFQSAELAGHGDNFFIGYWVYVAWDADGAGDPPQGEKLLCTASTDAGDITVAAFTDPLVVGDVVLLLHPAVMGDISIELGEMDDAITAANLSDLDFTSAHAKLGRIATDVVAANTAIADVLTEVETTSIDDGDGSIASNSRAGLLIRYTADTVLTILTAALAYLYNVAHTIPAIIDKIGDNTRSLYVMLGTRWDTSGDLGTDIASIIAGLGGSTVWQQQPSVVVDTDAETGPEVTIFDLSTATYSYMVNNLRLKFADPGVNIVTVKLYELINDSPIEVDSFEVDADNYGSYHSLMDMFGVNSLAGDDIEVTISLNAGGPYACTGQYQYAMAITS